MLSSINQQRIKCKADNSAKMFVPGPKPTEAFNKWSCFRNMQRLAPALLSLEAPSKNAHRIPSWIDTGGRGTWAGLESGGGRAE